MTRAGPLAAVLLDMDGVLLHSQEAWFRLMEECGRVFRGAPITRAEFTPTFGQSTREDVAVFGLRCTVEELDCFYAANFHRFADAVVVAPGARDVLESLRRRGLGLAVVTNTVTPLAQDLLTAAGLREWLPVVAGAGQVAHPKPAPDLVHHALAALGQPPEAACFVGDSRFDRQAAGAAGVRFIGLGIDGDRRIDGLHQLEPTLDLLAAD